ncbi:hypothetical protein Hanom_Chr06g00539291 [Helianthus anomalus]
MREWRTIYLKRSSWKKHRERLAFEQKNKSEEWGLRCLKKKLQASEHTLAEERRKWRVTCERDNKQMFVARTEIINLKACDEDLKKSESDYKDKYEEAKSHRERVEILQVSALFQFL